MINEARAGDKSRARRTLPDHWARDSDTGEGRGESGATGSFSEEAVDDRLIEHAEAP
ncbi:MAG: hypothetical protein HY791_36800 [Deltaproteobacteria bacterium]|nr:hypothetical protein [Deltaproteobacteria bacterium]